MTIAISPGKIILLGEHGVIYGKPCLSMAISLKVAVNVEMGNSYMVNMQPMDDKRHAYIKRAVEMIWNGKPLEITTFSQIPSASGLGSSAAITTAVVAALLKMKNDFSKIKVAENSFEVEYSVQGRASPNDTSTCTYGKAILVKNERQDGYLWSFSKGGNNWFIYPFEIPEIKIVIGTTGTKGKTPQLIKKISKFISSSSFATDLLNEMETLVLNGEKALKKNDMVEFGEIMNEDQKILRIFGASTKEIEKLISTAIKAGAYGAKLTGAGGGGSIIAIGSNPEKIADAIKKRGRDAYIIMPDKEGVKVW